MTKNGLSIVKRALRKDFGSVHAVKNPNLQDATGSRFGLLIAVGFSMVAIGMTAKNLNYEDTKSPTHQTNQMTEIMLPMMCLVASVFLVIVLSMLDLVIAMETVLGPLGVRLFFSLSGPLMIVLLGIAYVISGIRSLEAPG